MNRCIIFFAAILLCCAVKKNEPDSIFKQIENQEIIRKPELEKLLSCKFDGYQDVFIGTGRVLYSNKIASGIIQGKRNDTIFDILLVYKNDAFILCKQNPAATFYMKDGAAEREYMIGVAFINFADYNRSCIRAWFQSIHPYKIDTLRNMYRYSDMKVDKSDSLTFCDNR